jgi:hypothetical protein
VLTSSSEDFTSVLIRRKVLTRSQLQGARLLQRQTNSPLWDVLIEFGYASREQVYAAMYVDPDGSEEPDKFNDLVIDPTVIGLVPESVARENVIIPIQLIDGALQVAMVEPDDARLLARLKFILSCKIKAHRAPRERILDCINRHYGQTDQGSVDELLQDYTSSTVDFELTRDEDYPAAPRTLRGKLTDSASEFELSLGDDRSQSLMAGKRGEEKDVFETDFEMQAASAEAPDTDLESSDFDLALDDRGSSQPGHSRRTQLAMDDAPREAADCSMMCFTDSMADDDLLTKSAAMPAPAAARPVPAAAPPASPPRGAGVLATKNKASAAKPMVERQATIRYYSQMAPERMFPLLVVISRKAIMEVVKRDVVQKQSKKFTVQMDSTVEIEPILPGCDCFPPKENVRINAAESSARFWVVPRVLGEVMHARVVIRQNGKVLAEVPLEMNVAKQTLTLCVGAMNFCVPFVSMLLKQSQLSLTSSEGGSGLLAALVGWLLVMLSPEVMAGLLLLATVGLYFWLRPRQRDVFWDIQPVGR